jgi:hypothetical protein
MNGAARIDTLRDAAGWLVSRERQKTGSQMTAYANIAARVGASPSWLRKFLAASPEAKEPRWTIGDAILRQYDRLCARIEEEHATERAKILALKGEIDASTARAFGMVAAASIEAVAGTPKETDVT